jgi:hypothetical protein
MKNKLLVLISILALIPLFGCSQSTPEAPANPMATQAYVNTAIQGIQQQVSAKPDRSELTVLQTQINAGGGGNTYPKSETYSRSEVEKKIADAIQALKDDANAPWQKKYSNATTSIVPINSSQIATQPGGTVTMRIYTAPSNALIYPNQNDPVITGTGSYTWFLQFLNTDAVYHKVFLIGSMNPTTAISNTVNNSIVAVNCCCSAGVCNSPLSSCNTTLTWTPNFTGTTTNNSGFTTVITGISGDVQTSQTPAPATLSTTQSVSFTSVGYCVLSPGQVILIPVTLNLVYANPTPGYYTVTFNPSVQSYP